MFAAIRREVTHVRVRVSDPERMDELSEFLASERDVVVARRAEDELEVTILGSYGTGPMRMALYLRLRAWEAAAGAAGSFAEIVD